MLVHRQAFAGDQRFIDLGRAFHDLAIDGDAFAGPHHDQVADPHAGNRNFPVLAVPAQARGFGPQRIERPDGLGGLALGARFQPFAQQHQRDDDGRRLEIKMPGLAMAVFAVAQQQIDAQSVGRRGAHRHQQIHVARAGPNGFPAGLVKARAQPELHRRGEQQLQPAARHPGLAKQQAEHRQRQRRRQGCGHGDGPPGGARLRGLARTGAGILKRLRPVAGFIDGGDQLGHGSRAARHGHLGGLKRQVDFGRQHARHLLERLFHARDAGRAAHAFDGKAPFLEVGSGGQAGWQGLGDAHACSPEVAPPGRNGEAIEASLNLAIMAGSSAG